MKFRNLDASPEDPVSTWGVEGMLTAVDRGGLSQWRRIAAAVREQPYRDAARDLEQALVLAESAGAVALLKHALESARTSDKDRFALEFRSVLDQLGMTHQAAAEFLGTSRSRISSYCSAAVMPSAMAYWRLQNELDRRRATLVP